MILYVTGARGRLASYLVPFLRLQGHRVTTFSRNGSAEHLPLHKIEEEMKKKYPDALIHLAWSTVPASSEEVPGMEWEQDLALVARLARALLNHKAPRSMAAKFVFFSSCSVYGPGKNNVLSEKSLPQPIGWYAKAKHAAESLLEFFHLKTHLPVLILRISNPYGFEQDAKSLQGVIPAMVRAALGRKTFRIWGNQTIKKDFLHVHELGEILARCLRKGVQGKFNICFGESITLKALISEIRDRFGIFPLQAVKGKTWDIVQGTYSNKKICKAVSWTPKISIRKGLDMLAHRAPVNLPHRSKRK